MDQTVQRWDLQSLGSPASSAEILTSRTVTRFNQNSQFQTWTKQFLSTRFWNNPVSPSLQKLYDSRMRKSEMSDRVQSEVRLMMCVSASIYSVVFPNPFQKQQHCTFSAVCLHYSVHQTLEDLIFIAYICLHIHFFILIWTQPGQPRKGIYWLKMIIVLYSCVLFYFILFETFIYFISFYCLLFYCI